jgi:adenylate kinase family enzyme
LKKRIHLIGASGSGTSSIGKAVCNQIGYKHFDSDNYLWLPSEEPYTIIRPSEEYIGLMGNDLTNNEKWILSGHVSFGLGDVYLPLYELVAFIYVPADIRLERLKKREYERYGNEILPGGSRYEKASEFFEYAAGYDTVTTHGRNLHKHEAWLASVKCPVIKIINDSFEESVNILLEAIRK